MYYVEFDQSPEGLSLAGLFRSFRSQCRDGEAARHCTAADYLERFDKIRGCDTKLSKTLIRILSKIGHPDWVGVIARGGNKVKLIASLHENNIGPTKAFCSIHFANKFASIGISLEPTPLKSSNDYPNQYCGGGSI